jgi:MFS family permease
MVTSILGGFAWAMVGGALINYLLDKVPAEERPPYLAWYNIILNAAILFGSLLGPILANQIGLSTVLILFGVLRLLSGFAILRWG